MYYKITTSNNNKKKAKPLGQRTGKIQYNNKIMSKSIYKNNIIHIND